MSCSESDENLPTSTPPELRQAARDAAENILPTKSKSKYEHTYAAWLKWKKIKKGITSENCVIAYFQELFQKYKPPTVWARYSMLKSMLKLKENIDISQNHILLANLKKHSQGYESKKSMIFTGEDVKKFLNEAPDEIYLVHKIIMTIGVMGCCRGDELAQIRVQDIKQEGSLMVITIPKTKTQHPRQFTIDATLSTIIHKYQKLRPKNVSTDRFFLNYQNQKCTTQVIGKNKIAGTPKQIAKWLNLDNPHLYTGHALRRTSATLLSNSGGSMMDLKHLGGWQSDRVAQGYVENSIKNKTKISDLVAASINLESNVGDKSKQECLSPHHKKN